MFLLSGIRIANALPEHRAKFRQYRSKSCGAIVILRFYGGLGFSKIQIITRWNVLYITLFHHHNMVA